ncbi:MAG: DUF1178 family protein [Hyphomicrobium sp.]|jgi:hypothetical protein
MIKYRLVCDDGHEWEGWFQNSTAYDSQVARGQVSCPVCARTKVSKAVMAPSVVHERSSAAKQAPDGPGAASSKCETQEMLDFARKLRAEVRANAEYVGPRFADEARKIHLDESPARGIYGEATLDDAKSLAEDGIPFLPLPRLPDDLT